MSESSPNQDWAGNLPGEPTFLKHHRVNTHLLVVGFAKHFKETETKLLGHTNTFLQRHDLWHRPQQEDLTNPSRQKLHTHPINISAQADLLKKTPQPNFGSILYEMGLGLGTYAVPYAGAVPATGYWLLATSY